jgi:hypothetical protein
LLYRCLIGRSDVKSLANILAGDRRGILHQTSQSSAGGSVSHTQFHAKIKCIAPQPRWTSPLPSAKSSLCTPIVCCVPETIRRQYAPPKSLAPYLPKSCGCSARQAGETAWITCVVSYGSCVRKAKLKFCKKAKWWTRHGCKTCGAPFVSGKDDTQALSRGCQSLG